MKDRILAAYLKDFADSYGFVELDTPDVFEHFVASLLISKHHPFPFDPDDVTVAGDADMGIDGLAILVNDHLALANGDVDHLKKALRRLDVQFIFVQAKTSSHFEAAEVGSFLSGVRQFFDTTQPLANSNILALHAIKEYIFDSSKDMDQSPSCLLYYVTTGTWKDDKVVRARIDQSVADLMSTGLFSSVDFVPVDAEMLKRIHRELNRKITKEIVFEKHAIVPQIAGVDEAYIGIVPCLEYIRLVTDEEGNLNRRLFYDNVRDFQGHNPVNREVEKTVQDAERNDRFALLNNGVTVVARSVNKVGAKFCLRDYQVVNGCQTSHILYLNRQYLTAKVFLPLKLIVTDDTEVTNQIIQGTNRQTEVKIEAFESLDPFQKGLEEFYIAAGRDRGDPIYYERRSKQYDHLDVRRDRVISLATQIKSFVAMFLNEPQSTHRYYGELLASYRARLFNESHSHMPYFVSGLALATVERMVAQNRLPRALRSDRYQLLMVFRIQNQPAALPYLNSKGIEKYCEALVAILDDDSAAETALRGAGDLVESTRQAMASSRDPVQRTRAFTDALIARASGGKAQSAAKSARLCGNIKWYSDIIGYGFIAGEDGTDYFLHVTRIVGDACRSLAPGQKVEFAVVKTLRGLQAIDVEAAL